MIDKKLLILFLIMQLGVFFIVQGQTPAYPYYTYLVPLAPTSMGMDGDITPAEWGRANSYPLLSYESEGNLGNWSSWNDVYDAFVVWQAVWRRPNQLFISAAAWDVSRDSAIDNSHWDQNDAIHWWIESDISVPNPNWQWGTGDSNYLVPNLLSIPFSNSYFCQVSDGSFIECSNNTNEFYFGRQNYYVSNPSTSVWCVETRIKIASIYASDPSATLWYEITYHDADSGGDRQHRLAWNTTGSPVGGEPPIVPYERLGKLILSNTTEGKVSVWPEAEDFAENIVLASSRETTATNSIVRESKSLKQEPVWTFWHNYADAAPVWQARGDFSDKDSLKLFLNLLAFDDVIDSSYQSIIQNPVEDDGWIILTDINNNGSYDSGIDLNVLIHNNPDGPVRFWYSGEDEEYDTVDRGGPSVKAEFDSTRSGNWQAKVTITFSKEPFLSANPEKILRFELLYNDADGGGREHQFAWSTVDSGVTPWNDFANLGYLLPDWPDVMNAIKGENDTAPESFQLRCYPNPFSSQTSLVYSLGSTDHVTVKVYDIRGRLVTMLKDHLSAPGDYSLSWDGRGRNNQPVANGIYLIKMSISGKTKTSKIALIR